MESPSSDPVKILFVCLGNICRSPLAEGVFQHLARTEGASPALEVDSAGTGAYHVGEPADARARRVARDHGIELTGRARQVEPGDLDRFHRIIAMDHENLGHLHSMKQRFGGRATLHLLRDFDPEARKGDRDVPDPYYGGEDGFQTVFTMVHRSCRELLRELHEGEDGPPPLD